MLLTMLLLYDTMPMNLQNSSSGVRKVKVVRDEKLIASRGRLGKIASFTGLAILLLGLILSFYPPFFMASLLCLLAGLIVSNIGTYNLNRWVKRPRSDEVIARALKGLDDRFWLFSYVFPAEHVILAPSGLYVVNPKPHDGEISCEGDKWRRKFKWSRLLRALYEEGLGNPTAEVIAQADKMREFLRSKLSEEDEIEVREVILFTNPGVRLELKAPAVPVLTPKALKTHIRRKDKSSGLSGEQYRTLLKVLTEYAREKGLLKSGS